MTKSAPFFVAMAVACFVYALVGFGPGFIEGVAAGLHTIPLRIHLHGLVMMGWLGLVILQGSLVWAGQTRFHRRLGRLGLILFGLIWLMMIAFSLNNLVKPVPPPVEHLLNRIFAFQIVGIIVTPVLLILALRSVPDTEAHRRYMLFLTLSLIEAATVRMEFLPGTQGLDPNPYLTQLYPSLLLLPMIAFDLVTMKRLHRATVIGLSIIIAGRGLALLLWLWPAWSMMAGELGEQLSPVWPAFLS